MAQKKVSYFAQNRSLGSNNLNKKRLLMRKKKNLKLSTRKRLKLKNKKMKMNISMIGKESGDKAREQAIQKEKMEMIEKIMMTTTMMVGS